MYTTSLYFNSFLLFLPLTLSLPQQYGPQVIKTDRLHCSANQNDAVAPFTLQPQWADTMLNCLQQLKNTGWNGYECKPTAIATDGTTTALGPSFGFWKGEKNFDDLGGQECFDQCAPCLTQGIQWHMAVTTSCEYIFKGSVFARKKHCNMGFDYGT